MGGRAAGRAPTRTSRSRRSPTAATSSTTLPAGRVRGLRHRLDPDVVASVVDGGFHALVARWTLMLLAVSRAASSAASRVCKRKGRSDDRPWRRPRRSRGSGSCGARDRPTRSGRAFGAPSTGSGRVAPALRRRCRCRHRRHARPAPRSRVPAPSRRENRLPRSRRRIRALRSIRRQPSAKSRAVGSRATRAPELECLVPSRRLRLEQHDGCVVRGGGHDAEQADRAAAEDCHGVRRVDPAGAGRWRCRRPRRARPSRPSVNERSSGSLCSHSPRALKYSASAPSIEKPKWSRPAGPTTHSPTTRSPGCSPPTDGAGLDDLAAPLVPGDDRVRDRDDVAALVELEVRMADADGVGLDEDLVGADLRMIDVGDDRLVGGLEDQGFHRSPWIGCSSSWRRGRDQDLHVLRRGPRSAARSPIRPRPCRGGR